MVYPYTTVYGRKLIWQTRSLVYFLFFEVLNDDFEMQYFPGIHVQPISHHFYIISQTLIACTVGPCISDFFFYKLKHCQTMPSNWFILANTTISWLIFSIYCTQCETFSLSKFLTAVMFYPIQCRFTNV